MAFMFVYFVIVVAVVEISVVFLRATGLSRDVARFQVVSLLTSTGYTTKESELILDHPARRRIGMFLILFGVFSFAVVVSAIANIVAPAFRIAQMTLVAAVLVVLLFVARAPRTVAYLSAKLDDTMEEHYELHDFPIKDVLLRDDRDVFSEVKLDARSAYVGRAVGDFLPEDADLNLLFVRRGERTYRAERYAMPLEEGDGLVFFGHGDELDALFSRELAAAREKGDDA